MSEAVKNGKVNISEKDKYYQASTEISDVLTIPPNLVSHIESIDCVAKWVSKVKIEKSGGRHPAGWIPYELNEEQKGTIKGYGMGIINGAFLERGDMVLAVKPMAAHQAYSKSVKDRTNRQIDAYEELTDATGKKILDRGKKPL